MTISLVTQPGRKLWLLFRGQELLVSVEDYSFPKYENYTALGLNADEQHLVAEHNGMPVQLSLIHI